MEAHERNEGHRVSARGTGGSAGDGFRGRPNEPSIVSYAQNAEDVRLWRIFGKKPRGFYVDVGAGDPVLHSVTKLFYDAGWNGLNIEPGPTYPALVEARPRDINLEVAVATQEGETDFWVTSPDSGLSSLDAPDQDQMPPGFSATKTRVKCARLDRLLDENAAERVIDFLKIDVEGAEGDVLSSFDLDAIRPTVVLVEAISPLDNWRRHEQWEPLLLDHGYLFAAFDGINRFYVPVENAELVDTLAYPISVLDRYEPIDVVSERFRAVQALEQRTELLGRENAKLHGELAAVAEEARRLKLENSALETARSQVAAELSAVRATISWRVTRPLRALRSAHFRHRGHTVPAGMPKGLIPPLDHTHRSPGRSYADPVLEVTGVAAVEILRRCGEIRTGRTGAIRKCSVRSTWNLADFRRASDSDFVRAAHVILLGRLPGKAAAARRAAELKAGRSRYEILVRLALSPEGRRKRHHRVSGPALRSLVATGRGVDLAARTPVLGIVIRRMERLVRDEVPGTS